MMYIFNTRNVDRRFSEFYSPLEDLTRSNLIPFNIFVLALTLSISVNSKCFHSYFTVISLFKCDFRLG